MCKSVKIWQDCGHEVKPHFWPTLCICFGTPASRAERLNRSRWRVDADFCGLKELLLDGVDIGATRWIQLNDPCAAAMRLYVILLWPLVSIKYKMLRPWSRSRYKMIYFGVISVSLEWICSGANSAKTIRLLSLLSSDSRHLANATARTSTTCCGQ